MKMWAALDVHVLGDPDSLLVALDDFEATAIEEQGDPAHRVRVFFADSRYRDAALAGLPPRFQARPVDVPDEDWARRSQEGLAPVTVGAITIFPTSGSFIGRHDARHAALLIQPSMGFGTGHHATTRLCLAALQAIDLSGRVVVDVGTGSGVLALASSLLGAHDVLGIDSDGDAIQSARENLALNRHVHHVRFELVDVRAAALPPADVVTANLTGAVLTHAASVLLGMLRAGGTLILSGVQAHERAGVFGALTRARLIWEKEEDGWIGAAFRLEAALEA